MISKPIRRVCLAYREFNIRGEQNCTLIRKSLVGRMNMWELGYKQAGHRSSEAHSRSRRIDSSRRETQTENETKDWDRVFRLVVAFNSLWVLPISVVVCLHEHP